jgi:hypothetical protein
LQINFLQHSLFLLHGSPLILHIFLHFRLKQLYPSQHSPSRLHDVGHVVSNFSLLFVTINNIIKITAIAIICSVFIIYIYYNIFYFYFIYNFYIQLYGKYIRIN